MRGTNINWKRIWFLVALISFMVLYAYSGLGVVGSCDHSPEIVIEDRMESINGYNSTYWNNEGNIVKNSTYKMEGESSAQWNNSGVGSIIQLKSSYNQDCVANNISCYISLFVMYGGGLARSFGIRHPDDTTESTNFMEFLFDTTPYPDNMSIRCNSFGYTVSNFTFDRTVDYHLELYYDHLNTRAIYRMNSSDVAICDNPNNFGSTDDGKLWLGINTIHNVPVHVDYIQFCNDTYITNINCSSCKPPNGDTASPYTTSDTTPTFTFTTKNNILCRIGKQDQNYTTMNSSRNCNTTNSTNHVCSLSIQDEFINESPTYVYISCLDPDGNDKKKSTAGPLVMDISYDTVGDVFIVDGIYQSTIWPGATIYSNQHVYLRDIYNNQTQATFDKVAIYGNQRWAFNYLSEGETSIGSFFNLSPVFYFLEMSNLPTNKIITGVATLINSTKI